VVSNFPATIKKRVKYAGLCGRWRGVGASDALGCAALKTGDPSQGAKVDLWPGTRAPRTKPKGEGHNRGWQTSEDRGKQNYRWVSVEAKRLSDWLPVEAVFKNPHPKCKPTAH